MKRCEVGGQAVIEGVMMRGNKGIATAVRTPSGKIEINIKKTTSIVKKYKILGLPFIRGFFALIDSMKVGMDCLNYSASFFEEDEEEPGKFEKWIDEKLGDKANNVIMAVTMIISFILAIGLFMLLPTLIASLFKKVTASTVYLHIIEAVIRITILIGYMFFISKLKDIYRVFQYHGAEHKTIFCYEAMEDLTVENIKKQSRLHPRCGTNFIFLIMIISIIIFSLTGWGSIVQRLLLRVILIPVITGVSYEIIRFLGKNNSKLSKIIAYPGLKLQLLTTKEPDDSQIEVAIAALKASEGIEDKEKIIEQLLNEGTEVLKSVNIDTARLDCELLLGNIINKERIYLITHKEEAVDKNKEKQFVELLNKRKEKMPIKYILKKCDFYGIDLYVEEGVLIPRGDTEILVDEVLKRIPSEGEFKICDLCCGSGAIGISIACNRKDSFVDLIDYYDIPEKVTLINIEKNNVKDNTKFIKSNLLEQSIKEKSVYDVIVSNPPYIEEKEINNLMDDVKKYEPHTALSGGEDGLDFYKKIVEQSKKVLKKDGILAFEIGYNQGDSVKILMSENNYENVEIIKDFAGLDRIVIGISKNELYID